MWVSAVHWLEYRQPSTPAIKFEVQCYSDKLGGAKINAPDELDKLLHGCLLIRVHRSRCNADYQPEFGDVVVESHRLLLPTR